MTDMKKAEDNQRVICMKERLQQRELRINQKMWGKGSLIAFEAPGVAEACGGSPTRIIAALRTSPAEGRRTVPQLLHIRRTTTHNFILADTSALGWKNLNRLHTTCPMQLLPY